MKCLTLQLAIFLSEELVFSRSNFPWVCEDELALAPSHETTIESVQSYVCQIHSISLALVAEFCHRNLGQ